MGTIRRMKQLVIGAESEKTGERLRRGREPRAGYSQKGEDLMVKDRRRGREMVHGEKKPVSREEREEETKAQGKKVMGQRGG